MLASRPIHGNRCERTAFTLVEILVVVAIIALLIAILLPSLAEARHQARIVMCGTNLRTMGQATMFYAQASKDDMPAGYRRNDEGEVIMDTGFNTALLDFNSFEWLYPYVQKVSQRPSTFGASETMLLIPQYTCAEDRKQHTTNQVLMKTRQTEVDGKLHPVDFGLSYAANVSALSADGSGFPPVGAVDERRAVPQVPARKMSKINSPSSIVNISDGANDDAPGWTGWVLADCMADFGYNQCSFELRHKTGNQFLFIDGHVNFYTAVHLGKAKVAGDRENYGLPPYPSAFIPNWNSATFGGIKGNHEKYSTSPPQFASFGDYDSMGHFAPKTYEQTRQECDNGSGGC